MEEKLLDYDGLTFKSKVKLVHHLLAQMFEDKKLSNAEEVDRDMKIYLDILSNKILLIFCIISFRLNQAE